MLFEDAHGVLRGVLVGEEVELKTLAQQRVVDLADGAFEGGAGVGHQNVEAAIMGHRAVEGGAQRGCVGDVAADADGVVAGGLGDRGGLLGVEIHHHHMGAVGGEQFGRRRANGAGAAGDQGHLAGQRLRLVGGEFGLLQRPVFQFEQLAMGQRREAADGFGAAHCLDPHLADVGGDLRVFQRAAVAEHAEPGHQRQPRHGIEHGALDVVARIVALEIRRVVAHETGDMLADNRRPRVELVRVGGGQHHRPGLDADRQIRRRDADFGELRKARRIQERDNLRRCPEIADHPVEAAFAVVDGDRAAQRRGEIGRRRQLLRQDHRLRGRLAMPGHVVLRHGHITDHAVVGLARGGTEGEDAVLVQDQAFDGCVGVIDVGGGLGEVEARLDVGHETHLGAEHVAAQRLAVGLIHDRQDRGGMGVVDECVRQEGVQ